MLEFDGSRIQQSKISIPFVQAFICVEYGATFDPHERQNEPPCVPDTRVDILRQTMQWSADPCEKAVFWLHGTAGTGKSAIARTVKLVELLHTNGRANFHKSQCGISEPTTALTGQLVA